MSGWFVQLRIAFSMFSRPPLTVMPERLLSGSTFVSNVFFSAAVLRVQADNSNNAAPETCGVAMDVPLRFPKVPLGSVEIMFVPGAPRCTVVCPKLENKANPSVLVVAATETMFGAVYDAG